MITKDHMKSILTEEKAFLKMQEVKFVNVPAFDEIGVKKLYDKVIQRPNMSKYFPDKYPKGRQCCRQYMYNVWATIHPDDVKRVIEHANSQRYAITEDKAK